MHHRCLPRWSLMTTFKTIPPAIVRTISWNSSMHRPSFLKNPTGTASMRLPARPTENQMPFPQIIRLISNFWEARLPSICVPRLPTASPPRHCPPPAEGTHLPTAQTAPPKGKQGHGSTHFLEGTLWKSFYRFKTHPKAAETKRMR